MSVVPAQTIGAHCQYINSHQVHVVTHFSCFFFFNPSKKTLLTAPSVILELFYIPDKCVKSSKTVSFFKIRLLPPHVLGNCVCIWLVSILINNTSIYQHSGPVQFYGICTTPKHSMKFEPQQIVCMSECIGCCCEIFVLMSRWAVICFLEFLG